VLFGDSTVLLADEHFVWTSNKNCMYSYIESTHSNSPTTWMKMYVVRLATIIHLCYITNKHTNKEAYFQETDNMVILRITTM
jgi:hypothetical protein